VAVDSLLKESGVVVDVDDQFAFVKTQRSTGCSGCHSESGCGTLALSKLFVRDNSSPLKVKKTLDSNVGDEVELTLDESRLLKHSFMAYGLPLIGLFLISITASFIADNIFGLSDSSIELSAIFGGVVGLYLGWKYTQHFYKPILPELSSVLKKSQ